MDNSTLIILFGLLLSFYLGYTKRSVLTILASLIAMWILNIIFLSPLDLLINFFLGFIGLGVFGVLTWIGYAILNFAAWLVGHLLSPKSTTTKT